MSFDPRAVANYLLDIADLKHIRLSNLSLQKIVFFAHADFLTANGKPLVNKIFEAWKYGPVSPLLYHEFKKFGDGPILGRAQKLDFDTGQSITYDASPLSVHHDFLDGIVNFYGRLSPSTLVELSHAPNGAWASVWNVQQKRISGMAITDRIILDARSKNQI